MRSIVMWLSVFCLSACMFVCLFVRWHISKTTSMRHFLPVLWMTSCFHIIRPMGHNQRRTCYVSSRWRSLIYTVLCWWRYNDNVDDGDSNNNNNNNNINNNKNKNNNNDNNMALQRGNAVFFQNTISPNETSLKPFTLFSVNISACGFVLVDLK